MASAGCCRVAGERVYRNSAGVETTKVTKVTKVSWSWHCDGAGGICSYVSSSVQLRLCSSLPIPDPTQPRLTVTRRSGPVSTLIYIRAAARGGVVRSSGSGGGAASGVSCSSAHCPMAARRRGAASPLLSRRRSAPVVPPSSLRRLCSPSSSLSRSGPLESGMRCAGPLRVRSQWHAICGGRSVDAGGCDAPAISDLGAAARCPVVSVFGVSCRVGIWGARGPDAPGSGETRPGRDARLRVAALAAPLSDVNR